MLKRRLLQFRPFIALVVLFFAWSTIPVFVKSLLKTSFYEFQAPAEVSASYIRDLQDYWAARLKSKKELYERGQDLARLNARYEIAALENQSLREEVARLEQLLQLPSRQTYQYEIARVVKRDFTSWWQRIQIRKGKNADIQTDDPVVFVGGVVGRVSEVGLNTAWVDLVSNSHLRLAVVIEGDNRPMSFRGAGSRTFSRPVGLAEYVPTDTRIGDPQNLPRLITSGMGGIFPAGIHVGYISNTRQGAGGMYFDADVELDPRLMSITEVAVLIPIRRLDPDYQPESEETAAEAPSAPQS
ncbi:MAG: rod shape-determining protein MreC [Verrucomicrobiota bacterium]